MRKILNAMVMVIETLPASAGGAGIFLHAVVRIDMRERLPSPARHHRRGFFFACSELRKGSNRGGDRGRGVEQELPGAKPGSKRAGSRWVAGATVPRAAGGRAARRPGHLLRHRPRRAGRLHRPQRRRQVDDPQDADRHPAAQRGRGPGGGLRALAPAPPARAAHRHRLRPALAALVQLCRCAAASSSCAGSTTSSGPRIRRGCSG